jgi:Pentapeptide repeats (8 copies)
MAGWRGGRVGRAAIPTSHGVRNLCLPLLTVVAPWPTYHVPHLRQQDPEQGLILYDVSFRPTVQIGPDQRFVDRFDMKKMTILILGLFAVTVTLLTLADLGPLPAWLLNVERLPKEHLSQFQQLQLEQSIRTTVLQAVGGLLLVSGAVATWRQVVTARQTLTLSQSIMATDVFAKAVENLASDSSISRVGAVYTLDRIARDQPDERTRITALLTAFVRSAPENPLNNIGPDVQTALDVLVTGQYGPLNLDDACLRGAALSQANLKCASLRSAALNHAVLVRADLRDASLVDANLRGANLRSADIRGSDLNGADLTGATTEGVISSDYTRWPVDGPGGN